jgi:hypothetical protein
MKHAAGFPNSAATRITTLALPRVQSRDAGVTATEQMRTRAVSMVKLNLRYGAEKPALVRFAAWGVSVILGVKTLT